MADGHTLVIEGLSEQTFRGLSRLAQSHERSVEAEVRELLAERADRLGRFKTEGERWDYLRAEAERIRALTPKGVVQTDSTLLVREDRDRDDR